MHPEMACPAGPGHRAHPVMILEPYTVGWKVLLVALGVLREIPLKVVFVTLKVAH